MICLSFGYLILLTIVFNIFFSITYTPMMIRSLVSSALVLWFVAGFVIKCDS